MERTDLLRIREGMSGSQAADLLYSNDRKLCDAINSLKDDVETSKVVIGSLQGGGAATVSSLTVVSSTGTSLNNIMNQSGVTHAIEDVREDFSGTCFIDNTEVRDLQLSASVLTNADVAYKAATDLSGRSISGMIDTLLEYIESNNQTIKILTDRIAVLEGDLQKKK